MRYFGSKVSTLKDLYCLISERVPSGTFCDPFGGIGSVASHFQSKGYDVWSGDILNFTHYFQIARLKFSRKTFFKKLIQKLCLDNCEDLVAYLNDISPKKGWFVSEYSDRRKFFTNKNAEKIQACRRAIKAWNQEGWLSYDEHAVLLASLINSMDKVANTAGTYYAYLKTWHRKALTDFHFDFIEPVSCENKGRCFHEPASSLVRRRHFDVLYLDPPYNQRSYAHYYHLPETIALEKTPKIHGMSGIPNNIKTISQFNRPSGAKKSLVDLLDNASFGMMVFHYTDDGIIEPADVKSILSRYGTIEEFLIDSKGYTTKEKSKNVQHHLYLVQHA